MRNSKKFLPALLILLFFMTMASCKKDQANADRAAKKEVLNAGQSGGDQWIQVQPPNFVHANDAFNTSFTANEKVYVALQNPNELWQYDLTVSQWTLVQAPFFNFTFFGNDCRCVFVNGSNIYFLTNSGKSLKQYSLLTSQWTDKTAFPGSQGGSTSAYTGNQGYLMSGSGSDTENWEYDFVLNSWTLKANTPGSARTNAASFAIGDKVYYGLGIGAQIHINPITFKVTIVPVVESDWWEYNTTSNVWAIKAAFGGGTRWNSRGFATGGKVYLGLGWADLPGAIIKSDLWSYDPASNAWTQRASYPPGNNGSQWLNLVGTSTQGYAITNDLQAFWLYQPFYIINNKPPAIAGSGSIIQAQL
jgi:N-acetylneuraminic acid mutarotase